ncbi:MAG TPA: hypothetical protein VHG28_06135 [Longimicrobiaceae bacterium]|nr:hypothetical protein [Longimicrobiaceae bacterium]
MAQEKGPRTDRAYRDALARNHRLSRAEGIDAVMEKHRLDAIVAPTGSPGNSHGSPPVHLLATAGTAMAPGGA